ncbi:TRAP transporter large permease [Alicyclobacillus sp.]|uniref:TRAP transporter large permease n=1 Tax=Alicyclobacillus sp. TaxID=61169 RepID=UPI0025C5DA76|nr:TRAP transporter large permease [Alicyclobacillus sp.]MCL6517436.1 TRAP transporter large permease [Alicyclobacillus sp.]
MTVLLILAMIALVVLGMPIALALGVVAMFLILGTGEAPGNIIPISMFGGTNNFPLLAIPLFMVAGELMNACGLAERLINFATSLVGFITGGLAHVVVVTSMFYAEISGSSVADAAALGSVFIPEMKRRGYPGGMAAALLSCASTMAILIPPSLPMILYGVIADVSVAKLFLAGFVPGILVAIALGILSYRMAKKNGWEIPTTKFSFREVVRTFLQAFWALFLPVIILGGILGGIFTPTEAAGVAVFAALIIGLFIYRQLNWRDLPRILVSAANQTAVVMLIIATSAVLGWYLTSDQVPQQLADAMLSLTSNKYAILLLLNIFFLIVGMFLHSTAAIIMLVPILMPLINNVGIDPVQFGLILTMNLGIGQQTPPVASVLLTTCSVGKVSLAQTFPYLKYYVTAMLCILALITYIPQLTIQ